MSVWPHAIAFTLEAEGVDANHPGDHGGRTRFGISKVAHPKVDVANLTIEQAQKIYYDEYWLPIKGNDLPAQVAVVLFDWGVHAGPGRAIRRLQRLLGIPESGEVDDATLKAVRGARPPDLALDLILSRGRSLNAIIDADATQAVFREGWQARLINLAFFVARLG